MKIIECRDIRERYIDVVIANMKENGPYITEQFEYWLPEN